jgi:hypothetical protein
LTGGRDEDGDSADVLARDSGDESFGLHVSDADHVVVGRDPLITDDDVVTTRQQVGVGPSVVTNAYVVAPGRVVVKCGGTDGRVGGPGRIAKQRITPVGGVIIPGFVVVECTLPVSRVATTGSIDRKRIEPNGGVFIPDGVAAERI